MTIPAPRHTASTQARACRRAPCVTHGRESDRGAGRPVFCAPAHYNVYSFRNITRPRYFACSARFRLFVLQANGWRSRSAAAQTGPDRRAPISMGPDRLPLGTEICTLSGPATLRRAAPRAESVSSRFRQVYRRERVLLAVAIRRFSRGST